MVYVPSPALQLMFYGALSLWIALKFWARFDPDPSTFPPSSPPPPALTDTQFNYWALALGVACGLTISVKWTAMVTPAMIAMEVRCLLLAPAPRCIGCVAVLFSQIHSPRRTIRLALQHCAATVTYRYPVVAIIGISGMSSMQ